MFGFRIVPLLLFATGTCGVIYGGFYRRIPVIETREEEISVAVPVEPPMPPGAGPPGMDVFPPSWDFGPPVKFVTRIKTIQTTSDELEPAVNRAVSVGGIYRTEKGELARVGGSGDGAEGPSFCPT